MKIKSATTWRPAILSRPGTAWDRTICALEIFSDSRFSRIICAALGFDSTKIVSAAPRLIASIPTAPVPANTSMKNEPSTVLPNTLKRVSRKRSLVGRIFKAPGPFSTRLRYLPAITRTIYPTLLSHRRQMIPLPPRRTERFELGDHLGGAFRFFRERKSFATGQLQNLAIAQRLRN
jgi:hypothetical protein